MSTEPASHAHPPHVQPTQARHMPGREGCVWARLNSGSYRAQGD